jgi:hypothetical protein
MLTASVAAGSLRYDADGVAVVTTPAHHKHLLVRSTVVIAGECHRATSLHDLSVQNDTTTCLLIPRTVESVAQQTFSVWTSLRFVGFESLPRLRILGESAFADCQLRHIAIPGRIEVIGRCCFARCPNLRFVLFEFRSHLRQIGREAFLGCPIPQLAIPSTVSTISGSALMSIRSVAISPENQVFVYKDAILQNMHDKMSVRFFGDGPRVSIEPRIEVIGPFSFANVESIYAIDFTEDSSLREVSQCAFFQSALRTLVVPRSVETLGDRCFARCKALWEVSFEDGSRLNHIGELAFAFSGVRAIVLPASVEMIGVNAFADCRALTCVTMDGDSQLHVINEGAFMRTMIESFVIPPQLEVLGARAFAECGGLWRVIFPKECLLKILGERAFSATGLQRVSIPNSIEVISRGCFRQCSALTEVNFDGHSKLRRSDTYACPLMARQKMPALRHASALRLVAFEAAAIIRQLGEWAFCGSTIVEFVVPGTVEEIGKFCFHLCQVLSSVTFEPDGALRLIGDHAFSHTGLREVMIPKTVVTLGRQCFDSCRLLTTVEFEEPSALRVIQEGAFLWCSINRIRIPKSVQLERAKIFPDGCILVQDWKPSMSLMQYAPARFNGNNEMDTPKGRHLAIATPPSTVMSSTGSSPTLPFRTVVMQMRPTNADSQVNLPRMVPHLKTFNLVAHPRSSPRPLEPPPAGRLLPAPPHAAFFLAQPRLSTP